MKKLLLCFIVLFPLVLGCAAAVPLAGVSGGAVNLAIFWCNNEGRKYYEYDAETIHRAAKQALEKMGSRSRRTQRRRSRRGPRTD